MCIFLLIPVDSCDFCAIRGPDHHSGHIGQHRQEIPATDMRFCV